MSRKNKRKKNPIVSILEEVNITFTSKDTFQSSYPEVYNTMTGRELDKFTGEIEDNALVIPFISSGSSTYTKTILYGILSGNSLEKDYLSASYRIKELVNTIEEDKLVKNIVVKDTSDKPKSFETLKVLLDMVFNNKKISFISN
jgi:hypothetical protein